MKQEELDNLISKAQELKLLDRFLAQVDQKKIVSIQVPGISLTEENTWGIIVNLMHVIRARRSELSQEIKHLQIIKHRH